MRAALVAGVAAVIGLGGAAATSASEAADGGTGSYSLSGTSFDFDLDNSGTTSWEDFVLIGPPGTVFLGAATQGEITAPCSAGQPDGSANELECGPLASTGLAPGTRVLVVAAMATGAACGQPFQLEVSSTGTEPYTAAGAVSLSGSCAPPTTPVCVDMQALVAAAGSAHGLLGELATALDGRWTAAVAALAGAQSETREALAALNPTGAELGTLRSALASVSRALATARTAPRQQAAAQTAAAAASRTLAADQASLRSCAQAAAGSAPAAAVADSAPGCAGEHALVTSASTAARMVRTDTAEFRGDALAAIAAGLRSATSSRGDELSEPGAAGWQGAVRALRRAAALLVDASGPLAKLPGGAVAGDALEAATSALATCRAG